MFWLHPFLCHVYLLLSLVTVPLLTELDAICPNWTPYTTLLCIPHTVYCKPQSHSTSLHAICEWMLVSLHCSDGYNRMLLHSNCPATSLCYHFIDIPLHFSHSSSVLHLEIYTDSVSSLLLLAYINCVLIQEMFFLQLLSLWPNQCYQHTMLVDVFEAVVCLYEHCFGECVAIFIFNLWNCLMRTWLTWFGL